MARVLNTLFRWLEVLMAVFLAAMVALMFINVIARYVFSSGFVWSEEITRLCFIYLVYLGTIGAYRDNRHLGVDMLVHAVPPVVQKVVYILIQLIVIWVMWLLVQGSWDLAVQNLNDRWVATQYPRALIFGVGIITGAAIILIAAGNIFQLLVRRAPVSDLLAVREDDPIDEAAQDTSGIETRS